jgi:DNA adenine methylase
MIGPLAYIGGKRRLAPRLIPLLPPHTTYVEPFAGGAQLFFHKPRSRVEVLNDVDQEIVNLLRVCRDHDQELARWFRHTVASRTIFKILSTQSPNDLTDIQRAGRFLYLQKNCLGGHTGSRAFHYRVTLPVSFSPERIPKLLANAAERLNGVQLECLPYQDVLKRYDRPTTFFYCDPPYIGLRLYRHNFRDSEFEELADRLASLRGKFLLSINDTELAHRCFGRFHSQRVQFPYTAVRIPRPATELLFANFPLPAPP